MQIMNLNRIDELVSAALKRLTPESLLVKAETTLSKELGEISSQLASEAETHLEFFYTIVRKMAADIKLEKSEREKLAVLFRDHVFSESDVTMVIVKIHEFEKKVRWTAGKLAQANALKPEADRAQAQLAAFSPKAVSNLRTLVSSMYAKIQGVAAGISELNSLMINDPGLFGVVNVKELVEQRAKEISAQASNGSRDAARR